LANGGTFWKIMMGVGCGITLAVLALLSMCTACIGKVALDVEQQKEAKRRALTAVEVRDLEGEIDGDWFKVRGRVYNGGSEPVSFVKVQAEFLDRKGDVVDTDYTYAVSSEPLAAGASKTFDIMQRAGNRGERYRVTVMRD
jgi:hypothetical protein